MKLKIFIVVWCTVGSCYVAASYQSPSQRRYPVGVDKPIAAFLQRSLFESPQYWHPVVGNPQLYEILVSWAVTPPRKSSCGVNKQPVVPALPSTDLTDVLTLESNGGPTFPIGRLVPVARVVSSGTAFYLVHVGKPVHLK